MTETNIPALKKTLLEACIKKQQDVLESTRQAMLQAQESANEEKGTMGDKFESFREQMQIDRDMYARQFEEGKRVLDTLNRIDPEKANDKPALGALVFTDSQNFFVSVSLGQIKIPEGSFVAISGQSPMFQAMAGTKQGQRFQFRDKVFVVKQIG